MKQLLDLLRANHQVILTGAPGTGKTFLAREMAAAMLECSSNDLVRATRAQFGFVQFHPSYDYSDFVEGLKPTLVEGQITFELRDGVFKAFCNAAAKSPDQKHVFIIDEINRADLSRVFGELFFAIESSYRGDRVTTQYSYLRQDGTFTVPPNVFIIGTMNDIDRSVESLDFALRRRFAWREIEADDACFTRVADNLAERTGGARERYNALNKIIADLPSLGRSYMVGPAYFRQLSLYPNDNNCFELLWNNHIASLLKEYLRGMNDAPAAHRTMKDAYDLKAQDIKQ